jgi:hypothetical protein
MAAERVPVPAIPPDIGPVELCARCNDPEDMATWQKCELVFDEDSATVDSFAYLAVLCRNCSSNGKSVEVTPRLPWFPSGAALEQQASGALTGEECSN